jgi:RNA 2',3'-cyclic 3'-phosphodiesterase
MARLFFALWPGEDGARELGVVARSLAELAAGKPTPPEKIHLTLAFLGETDEERALTAGLAASKVRAVAFSFALDVVGSFKRSGIAWAGASQPVAELEGLQTSLARELAAAGFALEERPFAPHVTLARRIARRVPRAPMPPLEWRAREFTLVRTEPGSGRYTIVESWPLAGA